jgi:hypothetical protein
MFYICVKPSERRRICSGGKIWVKDMQTDVYVAKKDRGEWRTKEDARQHVTEDCEIIVEEKDV